MNRTQTPSRPALRYFGGKWKLAKWIIGYFPRHSCYVEPFGGAASVLLQKQPARQEIYNDLDEHVVDLFRLLRNPPMAEILIEQLKLTPFSRNEFEGCYNLMDETDPIEKARKMVAISYMGYSSDAFTNLKHKTGFRTVHERKNKWSNVVTSWNRFPASLRAVVERMKDVGIENRNAVKVIDDYDHPETLFYIDPPYPHNSRSDSNEYRHEMNNLQHGQLLEKLNEIHGMAVISTYENELYDSFLTQWTKICKKAIAQGGNGKAYKKVTECLYINPLAMKNKPQKSLF